MVRSSEIAPVPPREPWPSWPRAYGSCEARLLQALRSGRWTVRGAFTGGESQEIEFSRRFAEYTGRRHCVLAATGTLALGLAMEALEIGAGDEVLVPALTWIAPFVAVLESGATPVLVDVDRATTCMDVAAVRAALSPRTRAILAVHLHCSTADLDALAALARERDLVLIEDCSQAHAARWNHRPVGSVGAVGVFSMNQEKVLACGEGGAVVTDDPRVHEKLFRIKSSGCMLDPGLRTVGQDQLVYTDAVLGSNYCLSEFQAAVLLSQLEHLDELTERRNRNATYLDAGLRELGGITPISRPAGVTRPSYYEYGVFLDEEYRAGRSLLQTCDELSGRLGFCVHPTDAPIYASGFFSPGSRPRFRRQLTAEPLRRWRAAEFAGCEAVRGSLAVFHHSVLLATPARMDEIVEAFRASGGARRGGGRERIIQPRVAGGERHQGNAG